MKKVANQGFKQKNKILICELKLWFKVVCSRCDKLLKNVGDKICAHLLREKQSTKLENKSCEEELWTRVVTKIYEQKKRKKGPEQKL